MVTYQLDNAVLIVCAARKCKDNENQIKSQKLKTGREGLNLKIKNYIHISYNIFNHISMIYDYFYYYLNVFISSFLMHIQNCVLYDDNAVLINDNAVLIVYIWGLVP